MPTKTKNDKGAIEITLKPSADVPLSRLYSNHIEISLSPHDFTLKFCDATPIYNIDKAKNKIIHEIPIVAEIAIPFHVMKPLIVALQSQYDKHQEVTGGTNEKKPEKK